MGSSVSSQHQPGPAAVNLVCATPEDETIFPATFLREPNTICN